MMSVWRGSVWLLLVAFTASAQTSGDAGTAKKQVVLDVVVENKGGQVTPGALQQKDLNVFDNKRPVTLNSFRQVQGKDVPIRVVLLEDQVNIALRGMQDAHNQIVRFLRSNEGHLPYMTSVGVLGEKGITPVGSNSANGIELADALEKQGTKMRTETRSSGFYGATERMQQSLDALHLLLRDVQGKPGRTVVFWVSPGWPLLSGPAMELTGKQEQQLFDEILDISTKMREAHMTLYAVNPIGTAEGIGRQTYYENFLNGVNKPNDAEPGNLGLQVLATQSGGRVINSNDLGASLRTCYADLNEFYELTFDEAPSDNKILYHAVTVTIDQPGMKAQTRTGYYVHP